MVVAVDDLKLHLSFETAEALQSAVSLTQAVRDQAAAFRELNAASSEAQSSIKGSVVVADQAARSTKDSAQAATDAAKGYTQFNAAVENVNITIDQSRTSIKSIANETKNAGSAADEAGQMVDKWVSRYLTINGAIQLLSLLKDKLDQINEAQAALSGDRSMAMADNRSIVRMTGQSESVVEAAVENLTKSATGSTREQARAAMLAAGRFGDPTVKGSAAEREALAATQAGAVYGLSSDDIQGLVGADFNRGGKGGDSLRSLVSQIVAAAPQGTDPSVAVRGSIGAILPGLQHGEDPSDMLAIYADLLAKLGPERANMAMTQIRQKSEGGTTRSDKFFADQAAAMGMISPAAGTLDAAGQRTLRGDQERLTDARGTLADDQADLALDRKKLATLKSAPFKSKTASGRAEETQRRQVEIESMENAIERKEQAIAKAARSIADDEKNLASEIDKLGGEAGEKARLASYDSLTPAQKRAVMVAAVAGTNSPEAKQAISEAFGPRGSDAVSALGSDGGAGRRAALSRIAGAGAGAFGADAAAFSGSEAAGNAAAATAAQNTSVSGTSPGDAYLSQLRTKIEAQRKVEKSAGHDTKGAYLLYSDQQITNHEMAYQLYLELENIKGSISKEQYDSIYSQIEPLIDWKMTNIDISNADQTTVNLAAKAVGDLKAANAPKPARSAPRSPVSSPAGGAGHVSINNTYHIGGVYGAGDSDLPGALEQAGLA